jgi:hypothetical protein
MTFAGKPVTFLIPSNIESKRAFSLASSIFLPVAVSIAAVSS